MKRAISFEFLVFGAGLLLLAVARPSMGKYAGEVEGKWDASQERTKGDSGESEAEPVDERNAAVRAVGQLISESDGVEKALDGAMEKAERLKYPIYGIAGLAGAGIAGFLAKSIHDTVKGPSQKRKVLYGSLALATLAALSMVGGAVVIAQRKKQLQRANELAAALADKRLSLLEQVDGVDDAEAESEVKSRINSLADRIAEHATLPVQLVDEGFLPGVNTTESSD